MTTQADYALMLQKQSDLNLKYRTKIIQLQNQLNHEKIRSKNYQSQYKDAMLSSQYSQGQSLLQKLNNKQNQLLIYQNQLLQLNRKLNTQNNLPSQNDLIALARQNQELMMNIQEIKNAAISAIVVKEEEIQQLKRENQKYYVMENQLKYQYQKYQALEREMENVIKEKQDQIGQLNQKINREREVFLNKLETIQKQASLQQNYKEKLLQKTYDLQGNLQKSQSIINQYQNKIYQLQHQLSQQKLLNQQESTKLKFQIQDLQQSLKSFQKQQKNLSKYIQDYKLKQKSMQDNISKLNQKNQDLKHKLFMKKKKQNNKIKDKITASFSGLEKHNPVYTSFAFRPIDSIYQNVEENLGDIPEIDNLGEFIQNFSTQSIENPSDNNIPLNKPQKQQNKQSIPLSKIMSKNKDKPILTKQTSIVLQSNNDNKILNDKIDQLIKQSQNLKLVNMRSQTQKKQLQLNINNTYYQMSQLNKSLNNVTLQLQKQRKNISQLRQQLKKTKKQAELIVQMQSLTLHVQKLENDMIATKLKYAEQIDHERQKHQRQKVAWTQKLVKLTDKIAKQDLQIPQKQVKTQQKKKKKGFFG